MKSPNFNSVAEIGLARIVPGFLQLISISLLGRFLPASDFGVFSTGLATAGFAAIVLAGPVLHSIVPRHAAHAALGRSRTFERNALFLLLLAALGLSGAGGLLAWTGRLDASWALLAAGAALYNGWLPVLQARLQFWRYGVAALTNAALLLVLIQTSVSAAPSVSAAVWAFALSNTAGFLAGWVLCGAPLPRPPGRDMLRSMAGVGTSFTASNIAENGIYLGTRYAILWFGSAEFLGLFSLAVDLAQRSVGVVINIASFAIVPRAYKLAATGRREVFRMLLLRGAAVALVLSLSVFGIFAGFEAVGWNERLLGGTFSLPAFGAVSIAVVANRLKKMVLDPFAVETGRHAAIPISYAVAAPLSIGVSLLAAGMGAEGAILATYPAAYLLVAALLGATVTRRGGRQ